VLSRAAPVRPPPIGRVWLRGVAARAMSGTMEHGNERFGEKIWKRSVELGYIHGPSYGKPVDNVSQTGPWLLREPQPPPTRQAGGGGCGAGVGPGPQALALLLRLCGKRRKDLSVVRSSLVVSAVVEAGTAALGRPCSTPRGMHATIDGRGRVP